MLKNACLHQGRCPFLRILRILRIGPQARDVGDHPASPPRDRLDPLGLGGGRRLRIAHPILRGEGLDEVPLAEPVDPIVESLEPAAIGRCMSG
jgi:hypothetical protein